MNALIKCDQCGATVWTHAIDEPDVNATILDDSDPLDDGCAHMQDGGSVTIIDTNYDDSEPWDGD